MRLDPAQRFSSVRAFGRAILPFASPAAREQWSPGLAGTTDGERPATAMARCAHPHRADANSEPGGTVVLPPPDPSASPSRARPRAAVGLRGCRRRPTRPSAPAPRRSPTRITRQRPRPADRRPRGAGGGAAAAYFLTSPATTVAPHQRARSSPSTGQPPSSRRRRRSSHARIGCTSRPARRRRGWPIDGREVGTGQIDEEIASDGVAHTLTVTADGFAAARFRFRDEPPPEQVTLDPIAAAPPAAAAAAKRPVADTPRARPIGRAHERSRDRGTAAARPAAPSGARRPWCAARTTPRSSNSAPPRARHHLTR